jgi:hypothetical protein
MIGQIGGLQVRQPPQRSRPQLQPKPGPHVSQHSPYFMKANDAPLRPQPHPLPQSVLQDLILQEQPAVAAHKTPTAARRVNWLNIRIPPREPVSRTLRSKGAACRYFIGARGSRGSGKPLESLPMAPA